MEALTDKQLQEALNTLPKEQVRYEWDYDDKGNRQKTFIDPSYEIDIPPLYMTLDIHATESFDKEDNTIERFVEVELDDLLLDDVGFSMTEKQQKEVEYWVAEQIL